MANTGEDNMRKNTELHGLARSCMDIHVLAMDISIILDNPYIIRVGIGIGLVVGIGMVLLLGIPLIGNKMTLFQFMKMIMFKFLSLKMHCLSIV